MKSYSTGSCRAVGLRHGFIHQGEDESRQTMGKKKRQEGKMTVQMRKNTGGEGLPGH